MRSVGFLVGLGLLTTSLFALDFGIGLSGGVTSINDAKSASSQIGSQTAISGTVTVLVGFEDGWEGGTHFGINSLTHSDPNNVYNGEDGFNYTDYEVGLAVNGPLIAADNVKVLIGGSAFLGFGSSNKPYIPASGSSYSLSSLSGGVAFPVTLAYKLSPNVGLRLSNPLATITATSMQYKYSASTSTVNQNIVKVVPTSLAFGVYFYF